MTILLCTPERAAELKAASLQWPSLDLTEDQACLLDLVGIGVISGSRVLARLPLPEQATPGQPLALRDAEGTMLAALTLSDGSGGGEGGEAGVLEPVQRRNHYLYANLWAAPEDVEASGWVGAVLRRPAVDSDFAALRQASEAADHAPVLILSDLGPRATGDGDEVAAIRTHLDGIARLPAGSRVVAVALPSDATDELRNEVVEGFGAVEVSLPVPSAEDLAGNRPARSDRGFTLFFTGLSGSGKSTVANVVHARLREETGRPVTLLDGDVVRKNLSSELGFSKEHRDINVLRIGWVASEITRHGGIAICCPIAPYGEIRRQNRSAIEATGGGYILVHISTPVEECERRDRKGLYAKARAGLITGFTGIDDPYDVPADADLTIDTTDVTPEAAADQVVQHLNDQGWI